MAGESIELKLAGKRTRGYAVRPEKGNGPGLLLLGDNAITDRVVSDAADLYAEEGYVVLAPEVSETAEVIAAAGALRELPGVVGGIGGLGFGHGGTLLGRVAAQGGVVVLVCYDPPDIAALLATTDIP